MLTQLHVYSGCNANANNNVAYKSRQKLKGSMLQFTNKMAMKA